MTTNAHDKRKRKPDYDKRNFIVGVVVAILTALGVFLASKQPDSGGIKQTVNGGIGVVEGGIHTASQTVNNYFNPSSSQVAPVTSAPSPLGSIALPAPSTPKPAVESAFTVRDPYSHKAINTFGDFASGQDRDNYELGRQVISNARRPLGGYTLRQVIAEGRTARKKAEATQEVAHQRQEAERQEQERQEAAQRQEEARRQKQFAENFWPGDPSCLLVDRDSLRTEEIENAVYATGVVRNTCDKDFSYVDVEVNFHHSDGSVEESGLTSVLNLRSGVSWPWKIARQGIASGNWDVEKVNGM